MNKLLTALILVATAATAQASEEKIGFDPATGRFIDAKVEGFWDKFVCIGAGTCYRDSNGDLRKACSGGGCSLDIVPSSYSSGIRSSQIHLPGASYMVIQSGSTTSVIQTAK